MLTQQHVSNISEEYPPDLPTSTVKCTSVCVTEEILHTSAAEQVRNSPLSRVSLSVVVGTNRQRSYKRFVSFAPSDREMFYQMLKEECGREESR